MLPCQRQKESCSVISGDLFDMLLPMLSIYQEYVRNHHYSLQVLTECKQSSPSFAALLTRLENKTACGGRSLETFLTYPMHQVRHIIIIQFVSINKLIERRLTVVNFENLSVTYRQELIELLINGFYFALRIQHAWRNISGFLFHRPIFLSRIAQLLTN